MKTYTLRNDLNTFIRIGKRLFWHGVVLLTTPDRRIARKYARRWGVKFYVSAK